MAIDPLTTCDTAASWYNFTYPLSWSNRCEVAEVLSDIPFISVGILVFGVSALFLVTERLSLSAVWLFFSTLLAFVATVLDLGRTLADGTAMDTTKFIASEPCITAREVLLAFSTGLRFLFYWSYVAEPPRKVLSAAPIKTVQRIKFLALECIHEPHSGSWMRLGLPGKLLNVGLLVAITLITTLQIVWRVVPQFHQYSNVYGTDAALELLVSFLLLLKLLLNTVTLNSPDDMLVHSFGECLAPISGLLVNIAIGVGDLLCFAFTESTVGRLLQAFEVYIIVVFVVVVALLGYRDNLLSASQGEKHMDVVFTLPEPARGSTFRITPPIIETPRMSTILGTVAMQNRESTWALHRSARRSLHHMSSWVSSRVSRNRARYEDDEVRLWNAENVKVDPPYTGNIDTELTHSPAPLSTQESMGDPGDASANHTLIISALDTQSAVVHSMEGSDQVLHPSRANVQQCTNSPQARTNSVVVSSNPLQIAPGVNRAADVVVTPKASPVYGLSGTQSLASAPSSRTSLDELLRQQSQLDESIEVLKLFSARTPASPPHRNSTTSRRSVELTRSPSTGQRTVSSEVSLSNFPVPPCLTPVPSLPSSRPSSIKRIRGNRRARFLVARPIPTQDAYTSVGTPCLGSASLVDIPSSPCFSSSPLREESESFSVEAAKSSRFASDFEGTQYNVTSFIGGLATPGGQGQGNQENSWWPTESGSSAKVKLTPRMLPVPRRLEGLPASPAVAKLRPLACTSRPSQGDVASQPVNVAQFCAFPVAISQQTPVTGHAEEGIANTSVELVRRTDPHTTVSAAGVQSLRTFVRRRPPPLVIQKHTEQNPGISQVQVLVGD